MSGMAFGSWFAGVIFDHFGFYAPAFGFGVMFNLANLALVSFLLFRQSTHRRFVGDTLPVQISNEIAGPQNDVNSELRDHNAVSRRLSNTARAVNP